MPAFVQIASRLFNQPLLLAPDAAETVASVLLSRMGEDPLVDLAQWEKPEESASRFVGDPVVRDGRYAGYRMAGNGVAILSVMGELVNRGAWMGSSSGLTSYEGLSHQLRAAASDPQVRSILLDMESPGGEAMGAFEMADTVRAIAKEKPVTAVANGYAASAAYAIASAATRIVVPPSGAVGSIGVVMLHLDRSGELAKRGIKPTLIFAGEHKVDGNPFAELSADVRDRFQEGVDRTYADFVRTVAAGRRKMTEAAVRDTKARMFRGSDAVSVGLADAVGTFEEALSDLQRQRTNVTITPVRMNMSDTTAGADAPKMIGLAEHESALAAARHEGAAAESARIKAILTSDEAKGRDKMAAHLAFNTTQSADEARALLGVSAQEATVPSGEQSFLDRKQDALAPGIPDGPKADAAKAGWSTAIAAANRQFNA